MLQADPAGPPGLHLLGNMQLKLFVSACLAVPSTPGFCHEKGIENIQHLRQAIPFLAIGKLCWLWKVRPIMEHLMCCIFEVKKASWCFCLALDRQTTCRPLTDPSA